MNNTPDYLAAEAARARESSQVWRTAITAITLLLLCVLIVLSAGRYWPGTQDLKDKFAEDMRVKVEAQDEQIAAYQKNYSGAFASHVAAIGARLDSWNKQETDRAKQMADTINAQAAVLRRALKTVTATTNELSRMAAAVCRSWPTNASVEVEGGALLTTSISNETVEAEVVEEPVEGSSD